MGTFAAENLSSFGVNPILMSFLMVALAILPLCLLSVTSFIKFNVVFNLLRNAIGAQQVPSGLIVTLLSIVLTALVMSPVAKSCFVTFNEHYATENSNVEKIDIVGLVRGLKAATIPLKLFLAKHAKMREREFFAQLVLEQEETDLGESESQPSDSPSIDRAVTAQMEIQTEEIKGESIYSLVPAFIFSELAKAFEIGFMLFLPFLIVDIAIANILMALGMAMVNPISISLPFKILLFVLCDGWFLLTKGLVLGYLA